MTKTWKFRRLRVFHDADIETGDPFMRSPSAPRLWRATRSRGRRFSPAMLEKPPTATLSGLSDLSEKNTIQRTKKNILRRLLRDLMHRTQRLASRENGGRVVGLIKEHTARNGAVANEDGS